MSELKLYRPEAGDVDTVPDDGPQIFRIEDYFDRRPPRRELFPSRHDDEADTVDRARILHLNRRCPYCKHPVVEPLELNDGRMNRNRSRVPGTATVVGFHCQGCYLEWPA